MGKNVINYVNVNTFQLFFLVKEQAKQQEMRHEMSTHTHQSFKKSKDKYYEAQMLHCGKKDILRQITLLFQMLSLLYSLRTFSPFGPECGTIQRIQGTLFMKDQMLSISVTSRVLCLHKHRTLFSLQTVFIMVDVLK